MLVLQCPSWSKSWLRVRGNGRALRAPVEGMEGEMWGLRGGQACGIPRTSQEADGRQKGRDPAVCVL